MNEEKKENKIEKTGVDEKKAFTSKVENADATVSKLEQKAGKEIKGAPEKKETQTLQEQLDMFVKEMRAFDKEQDPMKKGNTLVHHVKLLFALNEACLELDDAGQAAFIQKLNKGLGSDNGWIAVKDGAGFEMVERDRPKEMRRVGVEVDMYAAQMRKFDKEKDPLKRRAPDPSLKFVLQEACIKLDEEGQANFIQALNQKFGNDTGWIAVKDGPSFEIVQNNQPAGTKSLDPNAIADSIDGPGLQETMDSLRNTPKKLNSDAVAQSIDGPGLKETMDSLRSTQKKKETSKTSAEPMASDVKNTAAPFQKEAEALEKELDDTVKEEEKKPEEKKSTPEKTGKKTFAQDADDLEKELDEAVKEEKPATAKKETSADAPIDPTFAAESSKGYLQEIKEPRARTDQAEHQHIVFKNARYIRVLEEYGSALRDEIGMINRNQATWKKDPALKDHEEKRLQTLKAELEELMKPEPEAPKAPEPEVPKTAMGRYLLKISRVRNWIDKYESKATAEGADGTLADDYWRALKDEVKMINDNKEVWSVDKDGVRTEVARRNDLQARLTEHGQKTAIEKRRSDERKEVNRAQDPKLVKTMRRNEDLVYALCTDPSDRQQIMNDLNGFERNRGYPLSNVTREIGRKIAHLEDLHQWMSRESPRGWTNGDGIDWTFKRGREVTSGNSDDVTDSIGARVRVALDNGSLTQKDLDEYMDKVMSWGQKKKQTFRAALVDRLPTILEQQPGKAPKIRPPKEQPIRPTVAAKRNPIKEIKTANKNFKKSSFLSPEEKAIVAQAETANTNEVTPDMAEALDTIADRLDTMQAFDRLLDPQAPVKNGRLQWRKSDNKRTEWYFDKHMRRAMLAGRIDEHTATDYFTKHLGMNPDEAAQAVKSLQARVELTFRDPKKHLRDLQANINSLTAARESIRKMPQSAEKKKMLREVESQLKMDQELLTEFQDIEREAKGYAKKENKDIAKGGKKRGSKKKV